MRHRSSARRSKFVAAAKFVVVLASLFTVGWVFAAGSFSEVSSPVPAIDAAIDPNLVAELTGDDGRMHFFVELHGMPAGQAWVARMAEFAGRTPEALAAAAADSRRQALENEAAQAAIAGQLSALGAEELYRLTKAANGFVIRVEPSKVAAIRRLSGVRSVGVVFPETPTNSTSVPFIDAPPAWANTLGLGVNLTGAGIRVGIIDTGIDYQHTHFGGSGLNADYLANDRTVAPDAYFPTTKVVGGRDFAGDTYNAGGNGGTTGSTTPVPDTDPMDCNRHGTHVAGTAAGYGVNADGTTYAGPWNTSTPFASLRIGPGVAPQAQLYGLRVFGCTGSTTLTAQAIEWAMDPNGDSDFSDHLDVINMSLGSNFGSANDLTAQTSDLAAAVGVIVVASAGNAGDTHFITGSPGAAGRAISVAASQDSGLPGAVLTVNSPPAIAAGYAAAASAYTNTVAPQPPAPSGQTANIIFVDDGSTAGAGTINDGCQTPFVNAAAVVGNIALMDRGGCNFTVKAQNAQANGAIGAIIANNVVGDPVPNVMGGGPATPSITIPGISVSKATRDLIVAQLGSGPVNGTLSSATAADTVAGFSSRGPRRASSPIKLKPEIAAPGQTITSAQTGVSSAGGSCVPTCPVSFANAGLNTSLNLNGTSMAAPHVAGVMALLRQLHPTWTVEELKALVMNYANHDVFLGSNGSGPRFAPSRIGGGRVDVAQAAQGQVLAMSQDDPGLVSVSFGTEVVSNLVLTRTVRLVNHGTTAQTYDLAVDPVLDAPGVNITLPGGSSVTVPAGGTTSITVQLAATASAMDNAYDPTMPTTQAVTSTAGGLNALGALARHRMTEETGYITFSQGGNLELRVPYYSAPRPASQMAGGTIVTGGAGTGSTTIPLTGIDVCTGTLGAGPTCSGTFPTEEISLVSPFELQLTSPRNPDLALVDSYGDIQHVGVAADATGTNIFFGISSWSNWSSGNDTVYNIWIDNNEDGTWDFVVFNGSLGQVSSRLFNSAESAQDNYLSWRFTPPATYTAQFFVNTSPAAADTDLFNSGVQVLTVQAAGIGLTAGNNNFRYRVESCPWFVPLCSALGGFVSGSGLDNTGAGFATWDRTARGLDFGGNILYFDLNGGNIPVTWNTANLATNASLGALLLHHHNTEGNQAQVVLLDTAQSADLAVTKSMSPTTPIFGQNSTFTLTVTNNGPNAATGIIVLDALPAGLAYVSDNGGGAYNSTTGEWTIASLANGASVSLQIVATVETVDTIYNTATISVATPLDPDPTDNSSTLTINAAEVADIELAMAVSSPTVLVGGSVTFTLTATNNGDDTGFGVAVNELFTGFEPLSPTANVPSVGVYNPTTGLWNVASLATGESATLALTFTAPNMAGLLTNNGTAGSGVADPDNANNVASAAVTVLSPATVTATKTVTGSFVPGGVVTYTVTLSNSSAYDQQNNAGNEFTDVLPAQLTLGTVSASSGTAVAAGNTATWNGVVPANGSVTITINATINAGTELQTVSNQGTTSTDADGNGVNEAAGVTDDPAVGGTTDPTSFVVGSPATLTATKTLTTTGPYLPGGFVSYEVVITNTSAFLQNDNPGDEFVDLLPSELVLVGASATSGTAVADLGGNTVTWNGSLAASASVTITIDATISPFVGDVTIVNQGTVNYDGDGNGTNESSTVTDDPSLPGGADGTPLIVGNLLEIPTLSQLGLLALALLLASAAWLAIRRT